MACISGNIDGKTKFDVTLHFTGYLAQLLSGYQNLKSGIKNHVGTYVLSSEEVNSDLLVLLDYPIDIPFYRTTVS